MSSAASLLNLHLAQAESALNRVFNNSYSDTRKEEYQQELFTLFYAIKTKIAAESPTVEREIFSIYKKQLNFIFKSLEFLDSSTLNQIPYEIVECLDSAMNDWINPDDNYIIVTSLINAVNEFSFDPNLVNNPTIYDEIEKSYSIKFKHKLVQINLPKSLARDYLAAVVLYHELGHFIDEINSISMSIARTIYSKLVAGSYPANIQNELSKFFPYLDDFISKGRSLKELYHYRNILQFHFAEYFCDLFASQYIGEASNHYLYYLTENSSNYGPYHPSTVNRINVVSDFLGSKANIIVTLSSEALFIIRGKKLEIRYEKLKNENIFELVPLSINNEKELHGVYCTIWDIWLNHIDKIKNVTGKVTPTIKIYSILNNLIEKSIGNYVTMKRWVNAKKK